MAHFGQISGFFGLFVILVCSLVVPQVQSQSKLFGTDAAPGEFPYLVGFKSAKDNKVRAGILVNFNRVLMAAKIAKDHCKPDECLIVAGTMDRQKIFDAKKEEVETTKTGDFQVRKVVSKVDHNCYLDGTNAYGSSYSVTLLTLNSDFETLPTKIELAWIHSVFDKIEGAGEVGEKKYGLHGADLSIAGWGATDEKETVFPATLQKLKVTIDTTHSGCTHKFEICVRSENVGAVCSGDQGGPLFVDLKGDGQTKNQKFVAGFAFSGDCKDNRATFVDMTKHVCWIINNATDTCEPDKQEMCPYDWHERKQEHTTQPPPTETTQATAAPETGGDMAANLTSPHIGFLLFVAIIGSFLWK